MVILVSNYRWPPSPGKQTLKQASCPVVQSCFSCTDPSTSDVLTSACGGPAGLPCPGTGEVLRVREGGSRAWRPVPLSACVPPLPQPRPPASLSRVLLLQTHLPFPQNWLRWGRRGMSGHIGQGGPWVHPGYPGWGNHDVLTHNINWLFIKHKCKYKAESKVSGISVIF